jgi:hypothetical protein
MTQHITITSEGRASLKPLIESAIQNEQRLLAHGLERTRQRLATFEKRFEMDSTVFETRLISGELEETLDFVEWLGELKSLRLLEENLQSLRETHLS